MLTKIKQEQIKARLNKETDEVLREKNVKKAKLLTTLLGECETLSKSKGKTLTNSEVFSIVEKFIKNNLQTIQSIGPHDERYNDLSDENEVLTSYLPSQLSEDDLRLEIEMFIANNGKGGVNMGAIMKYLKDTFPNQYDGKFASQLAKSML